jgi:hypothetical protein
MRQRATTNEMSDVNVLYAFLPPLNLIALRGPCTAWGKSERLQSYKPVYVYVRRDIGVLKALVHFLPEIGKRDRSRQTTLDKSNA